MRFNTLSQWLAWMEAGHPTEIELGLERVATVAARMGLDLAASQVVSVAGTNGKGSCVAALNALCQKAGLRVGSYTSPHFLRYNERVALDGQPVSDATLMAAFDRVDRALGDTSLTYFEFGTLAALSIFQRAGLDVVLLEVGLGGRLDAVNLVDADIAVVTSVDLDHQDWLGNDRETIGREKAGIFRAGRPAVCVDSAPPRSLCDYADDLGARLLLRGRAFDLVQAEAGDWHWWSEADPASAAPVAGLQHLALPVASVAAALEVARLLGIPPSHWACLSDLELPGRYQRVHCGRGQLLLDVAHNPAAATLLARRLGGRSGDGGRHALFAAMADKDIAGMLAPLRHSFDTWQVAGLPDNPRAAAAAWLAARVREQVSEPVCVHADVAAACESLRASLQAGDQVVVFGSFFTVAAAMQWCEAGGNGFSLDAGGESV